MAYASVDSTTLASLHVVMKCKFSFVLLYQLTFVLKNETEQLQGRFSGWIIGVLQLILGGFVMMFVKAY